MKNTNPIKRIINPNDLIVASRAGSDLNKFIKQYLCTQGITHIEYDGLFVVVNVAKRRIRFIELRCQNKKHEHAQLSALEILHYTMNHPSFGWKDLLANYSIVRGNYPFETAEISTLGNAPISVSRQQLINWLNFKREIGGTLNKQEPHESMKRQ